MQNNKPSAILVSYMNEKEALSIVKWSADSMHDEVGENYLEYASKFSDEELRMFFTKITEDGLATPLEYVPMVWRLANVSRALQQQLTRYRVGASFCIESMRVVSKKDFARNGLYHIPNTIANNKAKDSRYKEAMNTIESIYNDLLELGVSEEDARGILPLNIYSSITFSANFRTIMHILSTRKCLKTQGEFRDLSDIMIEEIENKMGVPIANSIKKPCECGKCLMIQENTTAIEAVVSGKIPRRPICPLFKTQFPTLNRNVEMFVEKYRALDYMKYEMPV